MKFMILTYGSQHDYDGMAGEASDLPAWTPEDFEAMDAFMTDLNRRLTESGELVETRALAAPAHTRRVQNGPAGTPVVSDGPYAASQEVLAGYWVVECDSVDRATEIAAQLADCPAPDHVRATAVADVRPIAEHAADDA